jgi:peptidoglycan/xylan/chitin deacetylase (PgdA/CDA1 family)
MRWLGRSGRGDVMVTRSTPWRGIRGSTLRASMACALALLPAAAVPASAERADVVRAGARDSGAVALTFDDGYDRDACASIARTLRAHGATGTFFVNGSRLKMAPDAWRDILEGQQVGNHTRSHRNLTRENDDVVRKQIWQNELLHERILGRPMLKVLRPPYGAHDRRVRAIAARLGYTHTVLWSVDTFDWRPSATVSSVISRGIGAPAGSIILMHCGPAVTPKALPRIIRHYQERGIELAGLDRVLGLSLGGVVHPELGAASAIGSLEEEPLVPSGLLLGIGATRAGFDVLYQGGAGPASIGLP